MIFVRRVNLQVYIKPFTSEYVLCFPFLLIFRYENIKCCCDFVQCSLLVNEMKSNVFLHHITQIDSEVFTFNGKLQS